MQLEDRQPSDTGSATPGEHRRNDEHVAWLTMRRNSDDDTKERELYVSLDGKRLGILTYGDVATLAIPIGRHEVRVHNTLSVRTLRFHAEAGQHIRLRTANVPGKGFAMWAIFVGAALMWTALEREEDGPRSVEPEPCPFRH